MGLDGLLLNCLVRELHAKLVNARVHHIAQPRANDVVLTLRQPGANFRLLLSADPTAPRVHLIEVDPANPLTPPAFCMLLRKHLDPARLLSIEQASLDRVVICKFEARDEMGRRVERHLITEMMSRHSNTILVDPESGLILDGVRHVTTEQSRHREVLPGKPYISPPAQDKSDPFLLEKDAFLFTLRHVPAPQPLAQALMDKYDGLGPDATREVLARAGFHSDIKREQLSSEQLVSVWESLNSIITALQQGSTMPWGARDRQRKPAYFWVLPLTHLCAPVEPTHFASVSDVLKWYYEERQAAANVENLRQSLLRPTKTAWEKVCKRISLQEQALRDAERADEYRLKGELLLAYPHLVPAKSAEVSLPNYYETDTNVAITLNPSFTASDNAQLYYRRYQKARKTEKQAQAQLEAANSEKDYLESVLEEIQLATDLADLVDIQDELRGQGLLPVVSKRAAASTAPSYLRVQAQDGAEILVGKNNRQNDAVTMGIARPDDIWLHVKDIPGAHVVIRTGGAPVSDDTFALALHLAAYYSRARSSSQVPVDYCPRRFVRKPKGAKPGFVIYDHQKTAYITPTIEEIKRLQH